MKDLELKNEIITMKNLLLITINSFELAGELVNLKIHQIKLTQVAPHTSQNGYN